MPDRRIALSVDDLRAVRSGAVTQFRRVGKEPARIAPGDRLWIAEPFRLHPHWDHMRPVNALQMSAAPALSFEIDGNPLDFPKLRLARSLPRALHRSHLHVIATRQCLLQELTPEDAIAENLVEDGGAPLAALRRRWAASERIRATFGGHPARWEDNPPVSIITFRFEGRPL